jgi:hypothetical protein
LFIEFFSPAPESGAKNSNFVTSVGEAHHDNPSFDLAYAVQPFLINAVSDVFDDYTLRIFKGETSLFKCNPMLGLVDDILILIPLIGVIAHKLYNLNTWYAIWFIWLFCMAIYFT